MSEEKIDTNASGSPLLAKSERDGNESPESGDKAKKEAIQDFEDVLRHVGGWGRFQKTMLAVSFPFTLFLSYVAYSPILINFTPDHWCAPDPQLSDALAAFTELDVVEMTIPLDENGKRSKCLMYDLPHLSQLKDVIGKGNVSFPVTECQFGWRFNYTGYFMSAASEMNWVCDDAWKPAFTQSLFYAGGIVGTLFFGYTADRLGRVWTIMASNTVVLVTGLLTPLCTDFFAFSAIRFLNGLSHCTFFTSMIMLMLEYVSIEKRSLVGNLSLAISLTVGGTYQPWLLKLVGDWKVFLFILYIQCIVIIAAPWLLHESVRWLASQGRIDECLVILASIAKKNGNEVDDEVYQSFKRMAQKQFDNGKAGERKSWLDLFRTPRLRKNTILMILTWMFIASLFDAHIRNIRNLNYSIYATFTVSAALELPADLAAIWGLNWLGRRSSAFLSLSLSGVCMAICGLCLEITWLSTLMAMFGRFFITYAMNTGTQITFEVVPTELRGQGNALANVFGQLGMFFSPYIVYSVVFHEALPFLILTIGSFAGAAVSAFLPETAGVQLPDTVAEAEQFGVGQDFFHLPGIEKRREERRDRAEVIGDVATKA